MSLADRSYRMAFSIAAIACACAPIAAIADLVARGRRSCFTRAGRGLGLPCPNRHEVHDLAVLAESFQQPAQPETPEDKRHHCSLGITWEYDVTHVHLPDKDPQTGVNNATQTWITYVADNATQTQTTDQASGSTQTQTTVDQANEATQTQTTDQANEATQTQTTDQTNYNQVNTATQTQLWWPLELGFGEAWRYAGGRRVTHRPPPPPPGSPRSPRSPRMSDRVAAYLTSQRFAQPPPPEDAKVTMLSMD